MLVVERNALIKFLQTQKGVELTSYGTPRDIFELPVDVPYWMSGQGTAEMPHYNVPAGTMVAVSGFETLANLDFEDLKHALANLDIYPMGGSGDFTPRGGRTLEQDKAERKQWFEERNKINNKLNSQAAIEESRSTLGRLHGKQLGELTDYLTDHMTIFYDRDGKLNPESEAQRRAIANGILAGLRKTMRYTRMESDKLTAFQFADEMMVTEDTGYENQSLERGEIRYHITGPKLVILRTEAGTGKTLLSPLDIQMINKSYVTADGKPLGKRAVVHMSSVPVPGKPGAMPTSQDVWNLLEGAYPHVPEEKLRDVVAEVGSKSHEKPAGKWAERAQADEKSGQKTR